MPYFYNSDDIIIEPSYINLKAYQVRYKYDLLGHPIGSREDFVRNPAGYLHTVISEHKLELIFSSLFMFSSLFILFLIQETFGRFLRLLKLAVTFSKEWMKARNDTRKRLKCGLPTNPDIHAQAAYRALTQFYKVNHGVDSLPIPETAIEYEAIRFALECAWTTGPGLRTLLEANPFLDPEMEPIEGLKEDEELERLLREMMPPIANDLMTNHTDDEMIDPDSREDNIDESGREDNEDSSSDSTLSGPNHHEISDNDYETFDIGKYQYFDNELHEHNAP
ncbi:hypothetical protein FBUS_11234 [Fasciolopsis buskii]|uniref:Uncharacterized protein n=1 Tax=Fasciolopsis buskii TaxID=27845 RepID=A0A8E0RTC0_9TREM|nr:hypothetical protein FBUS_11234 [Fasciolopsis buski]